MAAAPRTRLSLSADELDLLDDILAYYRAADYGGGDRDSKSDRTLLRSIEHRVDAARARLGEEVG